MRRQAGFTLMEVMVVVAIIAILTTLALVYINPNSKAVDVSTGVGELFREASREAVQYGTIRPNVVVASKARTKITATAGPNPTFTLQRFVEDTPDTATTGTWVIVESYTVPNGVTASAYATSVGAYASVSPQTTWSVVHDELLPERHVRSVLAVLRESRGHRLRIPVAGLGATARSRDLHPQGLELITRA